jgi:hypothetical protein
MLKQYILIAAIVSVGGATACQHVSSSNDGVASNANSAVASASKTPPQAPVPTPANVMTFNGGEANVIRNVQPVNGMLAPGIPDPKTMKKLTSKPGATPTPGIPDPATQREQLEKLYGKPAVQANTAVTPAVPAKANTNTKTPKKARKP